MINFSFSNNVFKSCLLLMRQNEYLWSKGLNDFEEEGFWEGKMLVTSILLLDIS